MNPGQPPRGPAASTNLRATAPSARHPAASHPGFEQEELAPPATSGAGLAAVLASVNAGFRQLADLLSLHAELTGLREAVLELRHQLEIERLARKTLEDRVKELEEDVEDTGQHRQKDIDRELERMRGSQAHWVRYVIGAVVAAVATLLVTVLTRR